MERDCILLAMNPTNLIRSTVNNPDFKLLASHLDRELAIIDGEDHAFFAQYNQTDAVQYVIVAYLDGSPVACGGLKSFDPRTLEVKRMYTIPSARGMGIASDILYHLETWAKELGYHRCILETGIKQPDAMRLYDKNHYSRIPNYGPYIHQPLSACFEKMLSH